MKKQLKHRPMLKTLEDRMLLSSSSWVPLDQVLLQGITQAGTVSPLSALNLYSPNISHNLAPTLQIPAGAVETSITATGEALYAVGDKYIAQISVTGLSAAAAANPKQLLGRAQAELAKAKVTNPSDQTLAAVTINEYLGAGRYLITASTNSNPMPRPFCNRPWPSSRASRTSCRTTCSRPAS